MYLSPRGAAWVAGITGCFTAAGVFAGIPPAVAAIGAEISYLCTTPVGVHRVAASVKVTAPATGVVGKPLQFGKAALELKVPAGLRADMEQKGAGESPPPAGQDPAVPSAVTGSARLGVLVSQGTKAMDAGWPVFTISTARPAGTGGKAEDGAETLRMTGTGALPELMPQAPGEITWAAKELALAFATDAAAGSSSPAVVCTAEGRAALGKVAVRGADQRPEAPAPGAGGRAAGTQAVAASTDCVKIPEYKSDPKSDFNSDPRLADVWVKPSLPDPPAPENWMENPPDPARRIGAPFCIRAAGFANVKKLGAAAPVGAVTLLRRAVYGIAPNRLAGNTANYFQQRGYFDTKASPTTATVLSFGFMPTTATTMVEQVAPPGSGEAGLVTGNLRTDLALNANNPGALRNGVQIPDETWAKAFVKMQVAKTSVNGTPIDMGPRCSSDPALLNLYTFTGDYNTGRVNIALGSTLTAQLDIPKFTGCGVGEDISPLLTASISGTGNYVQVESGPWCNTTVSVEQCDETTEPETWTVSPGGDVVVRQAPFELNSESGTGDGIRCDSLVMRGKIKKGRWKPRFLIGEMPDVKFSGCTLRAGTEAKPIKFTADVTPWGFHLEDANEDGTVRAKFVRVVMQTETEFGGEKCKLRFATNIRPNQVEKPGWMLGSYDNSTHTFTQSDTNRFVVSGSSDCPEPAPGYELDAGFGLTGDMVFDPAHKFTQP